MVTIALWFFNWALRACGSCWNQWRNSLWKGGFVIGKVLGGKPSAPTKPPYVKPRKYTEARRNSHHRRLGIVLGLLASSVTDSSPFRLKSDTILRQHFRQFRSFQGLMNVDKLKPQDMSLLRQHISRTSTEFAAATGGNENVFSAICDTGCSFSVTNNDQDIIPGTLQKLPEPIVLGGIAGNLKIEYRCRVHWDTVDDYGNVASLKPSAFYHPDIPNRLLSPQAFLTETSQNLDDHFRVFPDRTEWHKDGRRLCSMPYDNAFLPRITLFQKGTVQPTLQALQSVVSNSNQNLTPLQRIWMRWHIKLGHLSFTHVRKLASGGYLDLPALGLKQCDPNLLPKCAACRYGKQMRKPDHTTITKRKPESVGALKVGQLLPGDQVFCDQLESRVRGRLLHTAGREPERDRYCGSSLFCDAASGLIHVEHQVTLNATDSINAKTSFQ